jgi:4,5-dihydroxyphthalate decarboxylase
VKRVALTLALDEIDAVRPLVDGSVQPDGVDLVVETVTDATRFVRMSRREFDGAEYSISSYLLARALGRGDLVAIPVFPRRMFPHRFFFVRSDAGIAGPRDLAGRRVGIHSYENSLALVTRGMLQHDHGLAADSVRWVAGRTGLTGTAPPPGVHVEPRPDHRTLIEMLESGEIDALVVPEIPAPFRRGQPWLRRLFPDVRDAEITFYGKHRTFPIMHVVVLDHGVVERHPWIAVSLRDAFEEAKRRTYAFYEQPYRTSLAWAGWLWEEERALLGPDPFPHTVRDNRHDLELLMAWSVEQGLMPRPVPVASLFAPATVDP